MSESPPLPTSTYVLQAFKGELQAEGKGSAQDNINLATFENRLLPFPNVETQLAIVSTLDAVASETQRLEHVSEGATDLLDELKLSILHAAFSGGP